MELNFQLLLENQKIGQLSPVPALWSVWSRVGAASPDGVHPSGPPKSSAAHSTCLRFLPDPKFATCEKTERTEDSKPEDLG